MFRPIQNISQGLLGTFIGFMFATAMQAQNCDCERNYKKIFEKQKSSWMKGSSSQELEIKEHPLTTFSKFHNGSYYKRGTNTSNRIDSLKKQLQEFQQFIWPVTNPKFHERLWI